MLLLFGPEPLRGKVPGGDGDSSFCWQKSQASTVRKCMRPSCSCIASLVLSSLSSWHVGSCLCRILQRFFWSHVCHPWGGWNLLISWSCHSWCYRVYTEHNSQRWGCQHHPSWSWSSAEKWAQVCSSDRRSVCLLTNTISCSPSLTSTSECFAPATLFYFCLHILINQSA